LVSVKVLRNSDIRSLTVFIPPGHRHVRVILQLSDEAIVLHQATIDALIRAYTQVALHPQRRAIKLVLKRLSKYERKEGFAEYQLIEEVMSEDEILREATKLYYGSDETHATRPNEEHATG